MDILDITGTEIKPGYVLARSQRFADKSVLKFHVVLEVGKEKLAVRTAHAQYDPQDYQGSLPDIDIPAVIDRAELRDPIGWWRR